MQCAVIAAERYMRAAEWGKARGVTFDTVSNLAPKAIYALATRKYSKAVVDMVMAAAQCRPIAESDVLAIAKSGDKAVIFREIAAEQKAEEKARQVEARAAAAQNAERDAERAAQWAALQEAERAAQQQAEDILDGGGPDDLPPAPEPAVATPQATFDNAVEMLRSVMTKPLATFAAARTSSDDLERVAQFLSDVIERRNARKRANGARPEAESAAAGADQTLT
jgi:hypothetical protein